MDTALLHHNSQSVSAFSPTDNNLNPPASNFQQNTFDLPSDSMPPDIVPHLLTPSELRHPIRALRHTLPSKGCPENSPGIGKMSRHREWGPECGHSTMMRVYHPGLQCSICRRYPQFGWIYVCTVDKEALILKAKLRGHDVAFDQIGRAFADQMTLGKYAANLRTRKYAFLQEITASQLATYTPDELATILSQRDNLVATIAKERRRSDDGVLCDAGHKYPDNRRPWMPDEEKQCTHTVCQSCHGMAKDKSWVSLNGILNGDILPTVATGYAFSFAGCRPYLLADIAKTLGCRPVPFPKDHPVSVARRASAPWSLEDEVDSWFSSNCQRPEIIEPRADNSGDDDSLTDSSDESLEDEEAASVQWTRFPDPQLDEFHADITALSEISFDTELNHQASPLTDPIRSPYTPSDTPSNVVNKNSGEFLGNHTRSPSLLKTAPMVRTHLFSSFPSIGAVLGEEPNQNTDSKQTGNVGLGLSLSDDVLELACRIPLPSPDLAEKFLFAKGKISIGDFKHTEAFTKRNTRPVAPAVVHSAGGNMAVALMTEESVEAGIPDLVLSAGGDRDS